jgi:hypothetical protein
MNLNGVIEDARAFRTLPAALRGPTLLNFVKNLNPPDQKKVVLDLLELRHIPRTLDTAGLDVLAKAAGVPTAVVKEGFDLAAEAAVSPLLKVHPPGGSIDPVATVAAGKTRAHHEQLLAAYAKPRLSQRGITGTVEKVTGRLNALNLDDPRRLVLAQPPVYELLFLRALDDGKVASDDAAGIVDHIIGHVDEEALVHLMRGIVDAVLDARQISLTPIERDDLARLATTRGLPLRAGRVTDAVLGLVEVLQRQGKMPRFVDHYLTLQEIGLGEVDERLRQAMIDHLVFLKPNMTFERVVNREFDEYFAVAYDEARQQRSASDDPIDRALSGRRPSAAVDFTLRRVSERSTQTVNQVAIEAAGALFSIYTEDQLMRVFDIADALTLEWHRGGLDISDGDAADLLNQLEVKRDKRPTEAERGHHYRRIFNFGDAELLSGSHHNERFTEHFDRLMYEVTRFIDLQDLAAGDARQISRAGIFSAIRSLQLSLSQFVVGGVRTDILKLISHREEAFKLLESAPILARYGGVEQSVNSVIKNLAMQLLDVSMPVDDLFELAERGNDVFRFVAGFSRGSVRDEPFQEFLEAAQQMIIAKAVIDDGGWQPDRDHRRHRRRRSRDDDGDPSSRNGHEPVPAAIDEWDR